MGTTSGPGSVVSSVNASPPCGIGRQRPAKQNQSSPALVNFHFVFGRLGAGEFKEMRRRHEASPDREPASLGAEIDDGRTLCPDRRKAPACDRKLIRRVFHPANDGGRISRPMSSRGSRFGAALGHFTGIRVWL